MPRTRIRRVLYSNHYGKYRILTPFGTVVTRFGTPENRQKSSVFDKVAGILARFFLLKSNFHLSTLQPHKKILEKLLQSGQIYFLKKCMTTFSEQRDVDDCKDEGLRREIEQRGAFQTPS